MIWHDFDNRKSNQDSSLTDEIRNVALHVAAQDGNKTVQSTSTPADRFEELDSYITKANSSEISQEGGEKHVPAERTEDFESCPTASRDHVGLQGQDPGNNFGKNARFLHFYTTALILAAGGAVSPERVKVNSRCLYNLLP